MNLQHIWTSRSSLHDRSAIIASLPSRLLRHLESLLEFQVLRTVGSAMRRPLAQRAGMFRTRRADCNVLAGNIELGANEGSAGGLGAVGASGCGDGEFRLLLLQRSDQARREDFSDERDWDPLAAASGWEERYVAGGFVEQRGYAAPAVVMRAGCLHDMPHRLSFHAGNACLSPRRRLLLLLLLSLSLHRLWL